MTLKLAALETKVWAIGALNYSRSLNGLLSHRTIKSSQEALMYLRETEEASPTMASTVM